MDATDDEPDEVVCVSAQQGQPPEQPVAFDDFKRIDIRVARVVSAPLAEGTKAPCRVMTLDVGHLGLRTSVGQFALVPESALVGRNVVVCINLGRRKIGKHPSDALTLGAPHPDSPDDQEQATPLFVADEAILGDRIF